MTKRTLCLTVCLSILALLAGLASPATATDIKDVKIKKKASRTAKAAVDFRTQAGKEDIIGRSYAAVARYAGPSGSKLTFEVSKFSTLGRADFGRYRWFDLATMPGGRTIRITREIEHAAGAGKRLSYRPGWVDAPQDYAATREGRRFARLSVQEAFAAAARASQPELARVTALTTYQVTARLDGEARTYRAAFLWIEDGYDLTYIAYDHVTTGVGEALAETIPAGRGMRNTAAGDLDFLAESSEAAACNAGEVFLRAFPLQDAGSQGHTSGTHALDGTISFSCVCESSCAQTCSSNVSATCDDYGSTDTCHKVSGASQDSTNGYVPDARTQGASCGGGAGCAIQACSGCFCNPSVSVQYRGGTLSVSATSGAFTLQKSMPLTCPLCTVAPACNHNNVCDANESSATCNDCGCNSNSVCEQQRGETRSNCSDCTCNFDNTCESGVGETVNNCSDCGCNNNNICEGSRLETHLNCGDCVLGEEDDPNHTSGGEGGGGSGGGGGGGGNGDGGGGTCDADRDGWVTVSECYLQCGGWSDGEYCYV